MPKEVIIAHELWGKLRAAFLALKNTFQAKDLLADFELILNFVVDKYGNITDVELRYTVAIITYIQRRTKITEEEYLELIDQLPQNSKDMAASTYDNIYRNAKARGKTEGKAEGKAEAKAEKDTQFVTNLLLQTEFNDATIASLAAVSIDFVKSVKTAINSIRQTNFDDEKIASMTDIKPNLVQWIREKIQKEANGQSDNVQNSPN